MDRPPDLGAEDLVDETVLLDATAARKRRSGHARAEVVSAAGVILYLGLRSWYRGLDALLDLIGGWHGTHISDPHT